MGRVLRVAFTWVGRVLRTQVAGPRQKYMEVPPPPRGHGAVNEKRTGPVVFLSGAGADATDRWTLDHGATLHLLFSHPRPSIVILGHPIS